MQIVITGPESSGKSTLAVDICKYFDINYIPEYARKYLEINGSEYDYPDLLKIAQEYHKILLTEGKDTDLIVADTDLLTIKIWSEFKYGKVDPWIVKTLEEYKPDLYLLCSPDIPWQPDPLRENPDDRALLFRFYEKEIHSLDAAYHIISGDHEYRTNTAIEIISYLLQGMDP